MRKCLNFLILLTLFLVLCNFAVTASSEMQKIRIVSGSLTGSWFPLGTVVGEGPIKEAGFDYENTPGGAMSNVIAIQEGKADFGITMTSAIDLAVKGAEPYEYEMKDVVALNFLHPDPFHVAVTKKSGIESIEDFKGKTIAGAVPGQLSNFVMQEVFKACGIDPDEDMNLKIGSQTECMALIRDSHADGWVQLSAPPNPRLEEVMYSRDMKLLPVSNEAMEKIRGKGMGVMLYTFEPGTYPGQNEEVQTFQTPVIFAVNRNMPDEVAYKLAKSLVENIDVLRRQMFIMSDLTPEEMADIGETPVHPGAIKYYKEIGIWKN